MYFRSTLILILILAFGGQSSLAGHEGDRPSWLKRTARVVTFGLVGSEESSEQKASTTQEVAPEPTPETAPEVAAPEPEDDSEGKEPSLLGRSMGFLTFGLVGGEDKGERNPVGAAKTTRSDLKAIKSLAMEVKIRPEVIRLSETRRIHVRVRLMNGGKKMVSLRFPTTQRLEIRLIGRGSKVVEQWSESRAFSQILGHVAINPGERVEYHETISVRELVAGERYDLEVSIPGYPALTVARRVVPER